MESNPYFILEPGYQLILEGEENRQLARLEITVLHETKTITGVKTRVVEEVETIDNELVEVSNNYFAICQQDNSLGFDGGKTQPSLAKSRQSSSPPSTFVPEGFVFGIRNLGQVHSRTWGGGGAGV